jgi:dihydroxyacetone kinase
LDEVHAIAQKVCDTTRTLGLSFSTCTQPFSDVNREIGANIMEVGLGIHGEPGLEKAQVKPSKEIAKLVVDKILPCIDPENLKPGSKLAILVNNLGAVPPMEMTILVKDVFSVLPEGVEKILVGPGPLMTSLDMNGFSVTLMPASDQEIHTHLLSKCAPHCAWPYVSGDSSDIPTADSYPKDPLADQGANEAGNQK